MTTTDEIIMNQQVYFQSGQTRKLAFRLRSLKVLLQQLKRYENELIGALETDLDKAPYETFMTELSVVYRELSYCIQNLKYWNSSEIKRTRRFGGRANTEVRREPYGVALILSSWSNPLLNTLIPLIDALSAGNCVVIKPSIRTPITTDLLANLLAEIFPAKYVKVVVGSKNSAVKLIQDRPNFVFFNGHASNGRRVMREANRWLIPVSAHLDSKCPCVVSQTADIPLAAKRIIWAKLLNVGQSAYAPDYVIAHESIKTELIEQMITLLRSTYGFDPTHNPEFQRVVSREHFDRLRGLMNSGRIMWGGRANEETLRIEPTIIDRVSWKSPAMKQHIYGPVLPVLTYNDFTATLYSLNNLPHPTSLYLFSNDQHEIDLVKRFGIYGTCCINDLVVQTMYPDLPVGGVGYSGFGSYHGKAGHDLFSRLITIYESDGKKEKNYRYPPFPLNWSGLKRFFK
ncbi:MAG: aldehyde dehydrogenase family protein [Fastidiosipilaceae bacterium]|jgi:aldehyde dehydrogenase (NAD+)